MLAKARRIEKPAQINYDEGSGDVELTAHQDGDSVTLAVHNGGPPIPPDELGFVFEPLARGRTDSTRHSIGLGLFIARAIVSAHGGDIQVRSSADAGTTFTVALPRRSPESAPA